MVIVSLLKTPLGVRIAEQEETYPLGVVPEAQTRAQAILND